MELDFQSVRSEFLESLLSGNKRYCSKIIFDLLQKSIPFIDIYEHLIKEALIDVGELWELNKISVATEHLASSIAELVIDEHYSMINETKKTDKKVIIACVQSEFHRIGIKMVNNVFESNGWDTYFLGANTPMDDLIDLTKEIKPDLISISMTLYFHFPFLEMMIQKIRQEFPDTQVLIGGQGLSKVHSVSEQYAKVKYIPNLYVLESFIRKN
jgi:methanogenic corrinoid protein MtbC1